MTAANLSALRYLTLSLFAIFFALRPRGQWCPAGDCERDLKCPRGNERRAGKAEAAVFMKEGGASPNLAVAHLNLGLVRHMTSEYRSSTEDFPKLLS
jgi:hypothetical protein